MLVLDKSSSPLLLRRCQGHRRVRRTLELLHKYGDPRKLRQQNRSRDRSERTERGD